MWSCCFEECASIRIGERPEFYDRIAAEPRRCYVSNILITYCSLQLSFSHCSLPSHTSTLHTHSPSHLHTAHTFTFTPPHCTHRERLCHTAATNYTQSKFEELTKVRPHPFVLVNTEFISPNAQEISANEGLGRSLLQVLCYAGQLQFVRELSELHHHPHPSCLITLTLTRHVSSPSPVMSHHPHPHVMSHHPHPYFMSRHPHPSCLITLTLTSCLITLTSCLITLTLTSCLITLTLTSCLVTLTLTSCLITLTLTSCLITLTRHVSSPSPVMSHHPHPLCLITLTLTRHVSSPSPVMSHHPHPHPSCLITLTRYVSSPSPSFSSVMSHHPHPSCLITLTACLPQLRPTAVLMWTQCYAVWNRKPLQGRPHPLTSINHPSLSSGGYTFDLGGPYLTVDCGPSSSPFHPYSPSHPPFHLLTFPSTSTSSPPNFTLHLLTLLLILFHLTLPSILHLLTLPSTSSPSLPPPHLPLHFHTLPSTSSPSLPPPHLPLHLHTLPSTSSPSLQPSSTSSPSLQPLLTTTGLSRFPLWWASIRVCSSLIQCPPWMPASVPCLRGCYVPHHRRLLSS